MRSTCGYWERWQDCWEVLESSLATGEVLDGWRLVSVMLVNRKGWNGNRSNYRTVSLTSESGKAMKQIILGVITWHMWDYWGSRPIQRGFMKGKDQLYELQRLSVKFCPSVTTTSFIATGLGQTAQGNVTVSRGCQGKGRCNTEWCGLVSMVVMGW